MLGSYKITVASSKIRAKDWSDAGVLTENSIFFVCNDCCVWECDGAFIIFRILGAANIFHVFLDAEK